MRITRTPLRISLVGGGSDMPEYYVNHGPGAVLSFTIDKYVYVATTPRFEDGYRISYSKTEEVQDVDEIQHDIIRETLKFMDKKNMEVVTVADIPGKGTGLGSSSSLTVGLINSLLGVKDFFPYLANTAYEIERTLCGKPIGKQDAYAAAYGGMNYIRFQPWENVDVKYVPREVWHKFEKNFLLLYTGRTRSSGTILSKQAKNLKEDKDVIYTTKLMCEYAYDLFTDLTRGMDSIGHCLNESWKLKKKLAPNISDPKLDALYESARKAGAEGGKICGAGGGGFFLFYADPEKHQAIIEATGLRPVDFKITNEGSKIIYADTV